MWALLNSLSIRNFLKTDREKKPRDNFLNLTIIYRVIKKWIIRCKILIVSCWIILISSKIKGKTSPAEAIRLTLNFFLNFGQVRVKVN